MNKFIIKSLLKIAKEMISYKDVDQIRDNGGDKKRTQSFRPGRSDLKKKVNKREVNREDREDYKDTLFDEDLRSDK